MFRVFGFWGGLIVLVSAIAVNFALGYDSSMPRLAGLIGAMIAGFFWAYFADTFRRFRIVRKIFNVKKEQSDESLPWPEHGEIPERPHWWPEETPKGITKDSEDPRKYLR